MLKNTHIQFLGACQTVTGSKFHVTAFDKSILVDCGLFQGAKHLRKQNWNDLPIEVKELDFIVLTHGHLDHVGYLPRLIKQGFRGVILAPPPTLAITKIVLMDSAKIQEENAKRANEDNYTQHDPALPLYTIEEAEETIKLFTPVTEGEWFMLTEQIKCRFMYNGHILGSCFIEIEIAGEVLVFSGDLGREKDVLLNASKKVSKADYLVVESTYGNRLHPQEEVKTVLTKLVHEALLKKGNLVIPSFAVERLQSLMLILWELFKEGKIPYIPTFIDSPMGSRVLDTFEKFTNWHKLSKSEYKEMCAHFTITESYADTWKVIDDTRPKIIIAGSGMVTGGRVLTYLKYLIENPSTTILLVGYQAEGTRGRQLLEGASEIKFFGKHHPVKATVYAIESLSAHADQKELLNWMSAISNTPKKVFLVHGESTDIEAFRVKIEDQFNWKVVVPELFSTHKLI